MQCFPVRPGTALSRTALVAAGLLACAMLDWTAGWTDDLPKLPAPSDEQVARHHGLTVEQVHLLHGYRKLSNAALMQMPNQRVARVLWKLSNPRPDEPLGAAEYRRMLLAGGPNKTIPPNALGKAVAQVEKMRLAVPGKAVKPAPPPPKGRPVIAAAGSQTATGQTIYTVAGMPVGPLATSRPPAPAPGKPGVAGTGHDSSAGLLHLEIAPLPRGPAAPGTVAVAAAGGLTPARWKWLGPGNIGGRTRAIIIHPNDPNIIWVGAVAGGIWKTTNGGVSWDPVADFMASLNISCLVLDPKNSDVLYAGTGEGFYNLDAFRGAGIFKSTDGGATWKQLPATTGPDFNFVNRLALSPDGTTLLAATSTGLFRSTNPKEADLTKIKFQIASGLAQGDVLDVKYHPQDDQRCVAGARAGRAYYSIDGGATWKQANVLGSFDAGESFYGRVELAYALKNPDVVYASVDYNNGALYQSSNGGEKYNLRNSNTEYLSGQGWYGNAVWAGDDKDSDVVIVGGLDLYRSTDGGLTLTQISDWSVSPASAHADHHTIVSHPRYNADTNPVVYFGNDGGIYKNDNVRTATTQGGWHALNNNYGVTQFYGAAGNKDSGRFVGGAQDNGTLRYAPPPGPQTGPQAWKEMFGGDGGFCAADPLNSKFFYGEYIFLQIHRSANEGESSQYIYGGSAPLKDAGHRETALFIAPFILDPSDPNTMLAGGRSLWRSTNVRAQTPAWMAIYGPRGGNLISAVAAARQAPSGRSDQVWVGYTDGAVLRSSNATAAQPTFNQVGTGTLPDRLCTRVRVDPSNIKRVLACFSGYQSGNLWQTTEGGAGWTNVGAGLPEVPVYDVAIHPSNPDSVYAATEVGIFASDDSGTNWYPANQGPANVAVFELYWMEKILVAATHGRGAFWIDLSGVPSAAAGGGKPGGGGTPAGQKPPKERDHPAAAAKFYAQLHHNAQLQIPPNAMGKAIDKVKELRRATAQRHSIPHAVAGAFAGTGRQLLTVGGFPVGPLPTTPPASVPLHASLHFTDVAPDIAKALEAARPQNFPLAVGPHSAGWVSLGPTSVGGRTRALVVHPTLPQRLWTAGVDGGVWRSDDGGNSWVALQEFMASLVVSCLALNPKDPKQLYAGTGEGFYNLDAMRGFGIFHSKDGGDTWEQLANTGNDKFRWVNRMAFSSDGTVLLVATRDGLFRSEDFISFPAVGTPVNGEVLDVHFSPLNPPGTTAKCVASGWAGKAFYSEDGGKSWAAAQGLPSVPLASGVEGRVELAYAKADPNVVYAALDRNKGEIYRSLDGGKIYALRSTPRHLGYPDMDDSQGWYGNAIWAGDPTDPNLVIVGGIDVHRSSDGGATFDKISDWTQAPLSPHSDHHSFVSHATYDGVSNKKVYFCNDGGVYAAQDITTVNGASGWQQLNNGLVITQFYGAAANLKTKQIVAGAQDNATLLYTPMPLGGQWKEVSGGDGGFCAADPQAAAEQAVFYGEYVNLQISRSDLGAAAKDIFTGISDAGDSSLSLFIAPFILDPNNADVLLAGGSSLWRSKNPRDNTPSWTSIKDPLTVTVEGNSLNVRISALGMARGDSKVIWVGHELFPYAPSPESGAVYVTTNSDADQPTWTRVGKGRLPARHCTRIIPDPSAPAKRAYALFGGYEPDNLWITKDGGATWTPLGVGKLPAVPNYDLAFHPDDAKILILANETGVFFSGDTGTTWDPGNKGPSNCAVFQLFWMDRSLVAVTHGRGIFRFDLPPQTSTTSGPTPPKAKPQVKKPSG
jgi:photosystem II stability/assembly factor-like uncharacterized protein